jgi:hypothetical protein
MMAENVPKLRKDMNIQAYKAHRFLIRFNPKNLQKHVKIKLKKSKTKKIWKATREKRYVTYKVRSRRPSADMKKKFCGPGERGMMYSKC